MMIIFAYLPYGLAEGIKLSGEIRLSRILFPHALQSRVTLAGPERAWRGMAWRGVAGCGEVTWGMH